MYDYVLGGKDHYAADREAAHRILEAMPQLKDLVKANRAFLVRVVRFLVEQGIDQFLDIGSGIPTSPNVHEVAREVTPSARIVYVDNDPIVAVHSRALRATRDGVRAVEADLRNPSGILDNPEVRELIDFDRPVAVLLIDVLHFIADEEDPAKIVATIRDVLAPGSFIAISAACIDGVDKRSAGKVADVYRGATTPLIPRTEERIRSFFTGLELVEPGLASLPQWRHGGPDIPGGRAGVARKP
jgi:SAM-dependent methyltransferase